MRAGDLRGVADAPASADEELIPRPTRKPDRVGIMVALAQARAARADSRGWVEEPLTGDVTAIVPAGVTLDGDGAGI